jgi:hypothetical protein
VPLEGMPFPHGAKHRRALHGRLGQGDLAQQSIGIVKFPLADQKSGLRHPCP